MAVVTLRPYAEPDLGLLRSLLGDAHAMRFIGGAERDEAISARHARYLAVEPAVDSLFVIEEDSRPVGWIGFWGVGDAVCEAGWHVLASEQGRGLAGAALAQLIRLARTRGSYRYLDAYPAPENLASNALCRRAGFVDLGLVDIEYPKGRIMKAAHWRLDLVVG